LTYQWFKECYHILNTINEYVDMIHNILPTFLFLSFKAIITTTRTSWPKNRLSTHLYPLNKRLQRSTFWDITPCRPLRVKLCTGGTPKMCLYLRIEEDVKQNTSKETVRLCLQPSPRCNDMFHLNICWLSKDYTVLHCWRQNSLQPSHWWEP
jgi:hypothetical protein